MCVAVVVLACLLKLCMGLLLAVRPVSQLEQAQEHTQVCGEGGLSVCVFVFCVVVRREKEVCSGAEREGGRGGMTEHC